MKNLFKSTLVIALAFISVAGMAQEYKAAMRTGTLKIVEINSVTIVGTTGSEVVITSDRDGKLPERAEGLRPVGAAGLIDNTGLGLAIEDTEDGKALYQVSRNSAGKIKIMVPSSVKLHITHSGNQGGGIEISDFGGEIEADTRYNGLKMSNVTGPLLISTIYGAIEASFSSISDKDMSLVSSYGLVDVSLPSATKANLKLKSSYGDIFTDMDIDFDTKDGMRGVRSSEVSGKLNGGGANLYFEARYGNIYLRNKK